MSLQNSSKQLTTANSIAKVTPLLRPVLRLVHCLQKERGASSALVGSRTITIDDPSDTDQIYARNVVSARFATNSALSTFCEKVLQNSCSLDSEERALQLIPLLTQFRRFVDGTQPDDADHPEEAEAKKGLPSGLAPEDDDYDEFHKIFNNYNSLVKSIIRVFVVETVKNAQSDIKSLVKTSFVPGKEDPDSADVRVNERAMRLLSLLLSFVRLKESLGVERGILSGLMAVETRTKSGKRSIGFQGDEKYTPSLDDSEKSSNSMRLPIIINDLVMEVEYQHSTLRSIRTQIQSISGVDENCGSLLRLLGESIKLSDAMCDLQDRIREDFDVVGFQSSMTMQEFWTGITLYMDRLHSMELLIIEELDYCSFSNDGLGNVISALKDKLVSGAKNVAAPCEETPESAQTTSDEHAYQSLEKVVEKINIEEQEGPKALETLVKQNEPSEGASTLLQDHRFSISSSEPNEEPSPGLVEEWEIDLYEVQFRRRIGKGTVGTTYLAKWCGQYVAVKVATYNKVGFDGWSSELSSLKKLHHPNIIRFLGAIYNPSMLTYGLVLEYCNGGDLSRAVIKDTPPNFFLRVSFGVANGLCFLHKKHVLHRDIKPGNILLQGDVQGGNFTAKLSDFGLAVGAQGYSHCKGLVQSTGNFRYTSPEAIRDEQYNFAADIFSFAVILWELLTHENPFAPMTEDEVADSVGTKGMRPPFPSDVPQSIKNMIEQCWGDNPEERLNADDIIRELTEIDNKLSAESKLWLMSPRGHPVYKSVVPLTGDVKEPPKKTLAGVLKNGLFGRKKSKRAVVGFL